MTGQCYCPKCGLTSGDSWSNCGGACPLRESPYYSSAVELNTLISMLAQTQDPTRLNDKAAQSLIDQRRTIDNLAQRVKRMEKKLDTILDELKRGFDPGLMAQRLAKTND